MHGSLTLALPHADKGGWRRVEAGGTPPAGRYRHAAAVVGSRMVVIGGYRGTPLGDVALLDLGRLEWSAPAEVRGTAPTPRSSHTAVAWGERVVVFGGSDSLHYCNDVHVLDLGGGGGGPRWTRAETHGAPPPPMWGHCAWTHGGRMYVAGGMAGAVEVRGIRALRLADLAWEPAAPALASTRVPAMAAAVRVGGAALVLWGVRHNASAPGALAVRMDAGPAVARAVCRGEPAGGARSLTAACAGVDARGAFAVVFGGYSNEARFDDTWRVRVLGAAATLRELCLWELARREPVRGCAARLLARLPAELAADLTARMCACGTLRHPRDLPLLYYDQDHTEDDASAAVRRRRDGRDGGGGGGPKATGPRWPRELALSGDHVDDRWLGALTGVRAARLSLERLDLSSCPRVTNAAHHVLMSMQRLRSVLLPPPPAHRAPGANEVDR